MTQINKIQSVYFSPTGTTREILREISENIGIQAVESIDLTLSHDRQSWTGKVEGDLVLVGVPVYAATLPSNMLEPLRRLLGEGRWAITIVMYGNVTPGSSVEELCGILRRQGFEILAAAAFIEEHSFANEGFPLASGRPDATDLKNAADFGKKIAEKIDSGLREIPLKGKDLQERETPPERQAAELASVSEFDEGRCIGCLKCAESCPVEAIDTGTLDVNDDECIRCFACALVCPMGMRSIVFHMSSDILAWLESLMDVRKELKLYL